MHFFFFLYYLFFFLFFFFFFFFFNDTATTEIYTLSLHDALPIAVALDAPDLETAARWASQVTPHVSTVKVGLELYLRYGPGVLASVRGASQVQVFLDLKLHDIPATVAGAARAVARLRPALLTVHAAGGHAMIRAAVNAAPETQIAAVTVLTSLR